MKEDRRVRHSKERIREAMLTCLMDTGLEKITVKQLCETADVNRSTFYAHYTDPVDLYRRMESEWVDGLEKAMNAYEARIITYPDFLHAMLSYMAREEQTFLALAKTNSGSLRQCLLRQQEAHDVLPGHIRPWERTYAQNYFISGNLTVITQWLQGGMKEPIEEMASLIYYLTGGGIHGFDS